MYYLNSLLFSKNAKQLHKRQHNTIYPKLKFSAFLSKEITPNSRHILHILFLSNPLLLSTPPPPSSFERTPSPPSLAPPHKKLPSN